MKINRAQKLDPGIKQTISTGQQGQNILKSGDGVGRFRAQSSDISIPTFRSATHQLFVNSILRRVTNAQSSHLRRRAAEQLCHGNSAPFLALLGVSLASGSGLITKEDELECVCKEVRHASKKARLIEQSIEKELIELPPYDTTVTRENIEFGPAISKGCNAVVYSARWITTETTTSNEQIVDQPAGGPCLNLTRNGDDVQGKNEEQEFPLAVKMMFNYDIESNAYSILKAMQREMVVAQTMFMPDDTLDFLENQAKTIPSHPNIVRMVTAFADRVPDLEGSMDLYPAALPKRLNPSGYGRNMSLFLVMKRYDCSLRSFIQEQEEQLQWRSSLIILTQLLEGISHLVRHGVCHRDLKTDNILMDKSGTGDGSDFPLLAIADFGCCLADKKLGLKIPFTSNEIERGGNAALMAPEIATAQPGIFTYLDYSQADVWAAGTIAFEIFGCKNPFYDDVSKKRQLDSRHYSVSDLPNLPERVPKVLNSLIHDMLERQPNKRMSADLAATVCQLLLWAPRSWVDPESPSQPNTQDIIQWLLTMTTKVLYESRFSNTRKAHREYQLVATFLSRLTLKDTKTALNWIRENSF